MGKEYLELPFEVKEVSDDGIFKGYGSTFGGKPDSYGDVVDEGAFDSTIMNGGNNGFGVSMLWQHEAHNPIGTWLELSTNKKGLSVVGKLTKGVQQADEAHLLMKDGALRGLSIGFSVDKDGQEWDEKKNIRHLIKINLWEISPVTFPANNRAQITNVKAIEQAKSERELEAALREAGLSRKVSMMVTGLCKSSLRERRKSNNLNPILAALQNVNSIENNRLFN